MVEFFTLALKSVVFSSQRHLRCYADQSTNPFVMRLRDALDRSTNCSDWPTTVMTLGWLFDPWRRRTLPCFWPLTSFNTAVCLLTFPMKLRDDAISMRAYTLCLKNIPDIFDCNLKINYQILIIFGTNISDTTCHQMIIQFPTSPTVCFCTTWGKHNQRNIFFI